jgi:hypothetical protein
MNEPAEPDDELLAALDQLTDAVHWLSARTAYRAAEALSEAITAGSPRIRTPPTTARPTSRSELVASAMPSPPSRSPSTASTATTPTEPSNAPSPRRSTSGSPRSAPNTIAPSPCNAGSRPVGRPWKPVPSWGEHPVQLVEDPSGVAPRRSQFAEEAFEFGALIEKLAELFDHPRHLVIRQRCHRRRTQQRLEVLASQAVPHQDKSTNGRSADASAG